MPTVALLLAIEAMATLVFADLSSLLETYEESIIVPGFEGIHSITNNWRVNLGCCLHLASIQLGRADCVSIIPFISRWLSVITLHQLQWLA